MIITFGKHNGIDTDLLAKCAEGREYLSWGAEKLTSPKWRTEFAAALQRTSLGQVSHEEQARATVRIAPDISYDEALRWIREESEEGDRWAANEKAVYDAQSVIFAEWAESSGKTVADLRALYRRFEHDSEIESIPVGRFSSPEAKAMFVSYVGKLQACWNLVSL